MAQFRGGKKAFLVGVLLLGAAIVIGLVVMRARDAESISGNPSKTLVTPVMDARIRPGQNVVYCSTFQLAWNEYRTEVTGDLPDPPDIIKALERTETTRKDISEDSYLVVVGEIGDVLPRINSELKERFKEEAWILKRSEFAGLTDDTILAYAFLYKNLGFEEPFEDPDYPMAFTFEGQESPVDWFGIEKYDPGDGKQKAMGRQVSILHYKSDSDFVISVTGASKTEEIILAKVEPEGSLERTIEKVLERIEGGEKSGLEAYETVRMPKMNIKLRESFDEIGRYLLTIFAAEGPFVVEQRIHFRLDEKGAKLKSDARIAATVGEPDASPRRFVLDGPFLMCMREKGRKLPYLAVWVGNSDLLVKE